ncbi:MAG: hypothetical protein E6921_23340, partial [Klebsiella michiganensis]|nr:hypothetical protein [Klebsiella michiganensis]
MKHQHGRESAGMIFIARFMNSFLHQASFATGYWCYDRHRSVRLVVLVGLAIDQIAQSGLSSLSVIYYSAHLFSGGFHRWRNGNRLRLRDNGYLFSFNGRGRCADGFEFNLVSFN